MEPKTLPEVLTIIGRHNKLDMFQWKEDGQWQSLSSTNFVAHVIDYAELLETPPPSGPGIRQGDHVAFMIYNGPEWHIVRMACARIGAVSIPILTEVSDHDLGVILTKSRPKLVIVKDIGQEERMTKALGELGMNIPMVTLRFGRIGDAMMLQKFTSVPNSPSKNPPQTTEKDDTEGFQTYHTSVKPSEDDLAMIFFTSGTTSDPKGVMHTHKSLLSNINACRQIFPIGREDVTLSALPVSHIFQQAVDTLALIEGAAIAYTTPDKIRSALPEVQPSCMAAFPRMFELMAAMLPKRIEEKLKKSGKIKQKLVLYAMQMGQKNYSSSFKDRLCTMVTNPFLRRVRKGVREQVLGPRMRFFVSGGAPLPVHIGQFMQGALEVPIYQGWGMTELAGAGTCNNPNHNVIGSCGPTLPDVEIKLNPLPADFGGNLPKGAGEILIRGPILMLGYYEEPEATAETLQNGWLKTGDVGVFDKQGSLWIVDRIKGSIVLESGLKVMAQSLEDRVRSLCPLIEQIVVIGDKRPHLVALVYPNELVLKDRLPGTHRDKKKQWKDSVKSAIEQELKAVNLAPHETMRKIALLEKPLSPDDETLTPTQKPKRRNIQEKYADIIKSLYK